jgi:4-amino-4-deoxychorismate lyase
MSLFIESIKLIDGTFCNLFYHEQRMKRSLESLCGVDEDLNLEEFLKGMEYPSKGLYKCRIVYDDKVKEVEFVPYEIKPVTTLRVVESDRISYDYKFTDRKQIEKLFDKRDGCDDILIVKKGKITDSSYANIAFRNKDGDWVTPWSALLKGTMRQKLIDNNVVTVEDIAIDDLSSFTSFRLINAMLEFAAPEIDVSNIVS